MSTEIILLDKARAHPTCKEDEQIHCFAKRGDVCGIPVEN